MDIILILLGLLIILYFSQYLACKKDIEFFRENKKAIIDHYVLAFPINDHDIALFKHEDDDISDMYNDHIALHIDTKIIGAFLINEFYFLVSYSFSNFLLFDYHSIRKELIEGLTSKITNKN